MTWFIEKDHLYRENEGDVSRVGKSEDHSRIPVMAAVIGIQSEKLPGSDEDNFPRVKFRLKDDDGEVYYEGWLHDDDECLNQSSALKYAEDDAGCTTIEVWRGTGWTVEIG